MHTIKRVIGNVAEILEDICHNIVTWAENDDYERLKDWTNHNTGDWLSERLHETGYFIKQPYGWELKA